MSDWTYIQGSVSLDTSPYKFKKNKDGTYKVDEKHDCRFYSSRYLPFGREQMKIGFPDLRKRTTLEGAITDAHLAYRIELTSYPIIKESVDNHIKDMPQGELGLFYSLIKDHGHRSSSSYCDSQHVENLFYEHLKEVNKERMWQTITKKEIDKYFPSEIDWIDKNNESILTIHDSVRYCTASEMYKKLIAFFGALAKDGIGLGCGIFAFNDYFSFYTIRLDGDGIIAEIKEYGQEAKVEYWQIFTKNHWIRDDECELRQVDEFKKYRELNDESEYGREFKEYKAKYEPEEEVEQCVYSAKGN